MKTLSPLGAASGLLAFLVALLLGAAPALAADTPAQPGRTQPPISGRMVSVLRIPLQEPAYQNQLVLTLVEGDPTGGFWVLWHTGNDAQLQHHNDSAQPDRNRIELTNHRVQGLCGHRDGSLAMTWRESHMKAIFGVNLYLKKLSPSGDEIWNTKVRGDEGANLPYEQRPVGIWHHPDFQGPAVPIAFNGRQYGLFYVVLQKFDPPSCHTGDEFAMVNADGTIDRNCYRHTWNASHSFWMSTVAARNGQFYGITYADPIPYFGLRMGAYSQRRARQSLIWPARDWPGGMPCTRLSAAFNMGSLFAMAICSGIPRELSLLTEYDKEEVLQRTRQSEKKAYPILLRFDESGSTAASTYLTDEMVPDPVVCGARLGRDSALVAWGSGPGNSKGEVFGTLGADMAIVDRAGRILQAGIRADAPLTWNSNLETLENGDVLWAGLADEWTSRDNRNLLYLVHVRCPDSLRDRPPVRRKPKPVVRPRPRTPVDLKAEKADKLYRTAVDAERMGQRKTAETFYRKIVEEYPGTPAATKAAERLKKF